MRFWYFLLLIAIGTTGTLKGQSTCVAPNSTSDDGLFLIRNIVHGNRHADTVLRSRLSVNATADSQVTVLAVDSLCAHAMNVRSTDENIPLNASHVYQVGTQYWVDDPSPKKGRVMYVLNSSFSIIGLMRF